MSLFEVGGQFPPQNDIERLATYEAMEKFYAGNQHDVYERASELLKDTPFASQLSKLYIGCNLADVICSKPSELLLSEEPIFEGADNPESAEQQSLLRLKDENDLRQLIFDVTLGGAIRGDSFVKVLYNYRQDMSEFAKLKELFEGNMPNFKEPEADVMVQTVNPNFVFPELSNGTSHDFKAVNIAFIEWVDMGKEEIPHLVVERHTPYFIQYRRFELRFKYINDLYGEDISVYEIVQELETGKEENIIYTGVEVPLVFHFAYKKNDFRWWGTGAIEKIATLLVAVSDRLTSLDYILHKHSDPILSGPKIDGDEEMVRMSGAYVSRTNEDPEISYVTWEAHLSSAYQELDILLAKIFLQAQLPTWLFGSAITQASRTGGGTSHTDSTTTKLRYAPVSALLDRLTSGLKTTLGDAFYYAQVLENYMKTDDNGRAVRGFTSYEPLVPRLKLSNGVPRNERELVDVIVLRLQNKLIDQRTAIKLLDGLDDAYANEMIKQIEEDEKRMMSLLNENIVDPDIMDGESDLDPNE